MRDCPRTEPKMSNESQQVPTVLVIGSGGREHAIAWRLQVGAHRTPQADRHVVLAPGNPGAAKDVRCMEAAQTPEAIVALAKQLDASLVVIGPEQPLVDGAIDALLAANIPCVGPVQAAAQLEGSKAFMKDLCREAGVETAAYAVVKSVAEADAFIAEQEASGATRLVVKADGLCAGKGVTVCDDLDHARREVRAFLGADDDTSARFGQASQTVVLEEFLPGVEISVFGLCDSERAHLMATARDHKRLSDGDVGPNTGGMGAAGPLGPEHGVDDAFLEDVRANVFEKTLRALAARGMPYRGILYAGLMVHEGRTRLLEFNVRLGDPETQALLFGTDQDLLPTLMAIGRGESLPADTGALRQCAPVACVVLASEGYPEKPIKGRPIAFSTAADAGDDVKQTKIFYAGVATSEGDLVTSGGRVMACCATGTDLEEAIGRAYALAEGVSFGGAHRRSDIGQSLLAPSPDAALDENQKEART